MHDDPTPDRSNDDGSAHEDEPAVDAVGAQLAAAADSVEVGDPAVMLATVHTTVTRRRRRRNTVVGLAAAGTLVVSGVIVATLVDGGDGDDLIVSAPATEAPTTEVDEPAEDDTSAATVVTGDPGEVIEVPAEEAVPVRLVPATATDVVDAGLTIDITDSGQVRLFPWQDGFLSVRTTYEPQPLPAELPQEVIDAFPPEVVEFFADGLPPTIQEATAMLDEAGLLDAVTQVVLNNPAVSEAIYQEQGATNTTVRFSADGLEWSDVDAEFPVPDNSWNHVATTRDRFVIVVESGGEVPGVDPAVGTDPSPQVIQIYSSTDLVDWAVQEIPLPSPPAELGPGESFRPYINGAAVTDTGFLVSATASVEIDPIELLDPELRDRIRASGAISVGYGTDGVTIEIFGDDSFASPDESGSIPSAPESTETLTFTWEELGLDGQPNLGGEDSSTWVSTWDGAPTLVESSSVGWLAGVGDEFVELGPTPRRSTNGIDWVPIELPGEGYVDAMVETADGVAVRGTDDRGAQTVYVGDLATGGWTAIDTAELPANGTAESWGPNAFLVASYGDDDSGSLGGRPPDFVSSRQSAEVDGYRYELEVTQTINEYSVTYSLTDLGTGEVVVTESADGLSTEEDPFEYVQDGFGTSELTILDPVSGEPLVSIPYELMTQEFIAADGTVIDTDDAVSTSTAPEPSAATYWVLASIGDGWIVQQVSDGTDESRWPAGVAVAGDVVVVAWSDGTFTRVTAI